MAKEIPQGLAFDHSMAALLGENRDQVWEYQWLDLRVRTLEDAGQGGDIGGQP